MTRSNLCGRTLVCVRTESTLPKHSDFNFRNNSRLFPLSDMIYVLCSSNCCRVVLVQCCLMMYVCMARVFLGTGQGYD